MVVADDWAAMSGPENPSLTVPASVGRPMRALTVNESHVPMMPASMSTTLIVHCPGGLPAGISPQKACVTNVHWVMLVHLGSGSGKGSTRSGSLAEAPRKRRQVTPEGDVR